MKDLPRVIFLQVAGDQPRDPEASFSEYHEVSWCTERVFDSDYRYVLAEEEETGGTLIPGKEKGLMSDREAFAMVKRGGNPRNGKPSYSDRCHARICRHGRCDWCGAPMHCSQHGPLTEDDGKPWGHEFVPIGGPNDE